MPLDQQQLHQFSHLELLAKQVVEGFITGLHKSPFHGFSVEFAEHRIYNSGESIRHIDWKLFARSDKLFVKRYEEETNLRCHIIIDNSSSMYFSTSLPTSPVSFPALKLDRKVEGGVNKLTFSVYCAAALIYIFRKQLDATGLTIFSDKIEVHTQAKSNYAHQKNLFTELEILLEKSEKYKPQKEMKKTFATMVLHQVAELIQKRSLIILFSDMMDSISDKEELFSALQHLRHNKHEVILFHVTDKSKELNFEFENRPYHFVDMETGESVKIYPNEIKNAYIKSMAAYKKELMLRCAQYRIDYVEANIKKGFRQVLIPYLIKRTKMQQ